MQRISSIYVAPSPLGGRGVFTAAPIPEGSLIEICPMLVLKPEDCTYIDETDLFDYYFLWGEEEEAYAIALGFGSLYNHSFTPNACYRSDFAADLLQFYSLKDIEAGEELTVNYNGRPRVQNSVWFEVESKT